VDSGKLQQEILERDRLDSTREASPLRKAPGSLEVDTSSMSIEQQVQIVVDQAKEIVGV